MVKLKTILKGVLIFLQEFVLTCFIKFYINYYLPAMAATTRIIVLNNLNSYSLVHFSPDISQIERKSQHSLNKFDVF